VTVHQTLDSWPSPRPVAARIAVVGTGYVGTVVSACLAHIGHDVVGLESDEAKLTALQQGLPPFFEPGLTELLRAGLDSGRLRFTSDVAIAMASSDVIFLCVGTPEAPDGHADVQYLESAARALAQEMHAPKTFVTKSTAPIGNGEWLKGTIADVLRQREIRPTPFSVVSNPEFLRQGSAIEDYLHPACVVVGSEDQDALDRLVQIYDPILEQRFPGGDSRKRPKLVRTGLTTAEAVKYASNAFLALKVSFVNEIANICELLDADVGDVADAIGVDERIGRRFLDAGIGWGGSCFGKDVSELIAAARVRGYEARLLQAAIDVNRWQRELVVKKLRRHLHTLRGRRIGLLGLAYKPHTDDLRDAPAIEIARSLLEAGAQVIAHDPVVRDVAHVPGLLLADDAYDVADAADAVVLVTEWPQYLVLDLELLQERMAGRLIVDGRGVLVPDKVEAAGLVYEGIGRKSRPHS